MINGNLSMNKRGVKRHWLGRTQGWADEKVCTCHCHTKLGQGVRHMIACCSKPITSEGQKLLAAFLDEENYQQSVQDKDL
jgi:hypothetical protein